MDNIIILITGMPGTGKTTYARYLAEELALPLVCYDEIKSRAWELSRGGSPEAGAMALDVTAYGFFWYIMELLMKSRRPLIAEYFFHPDQSQTLSGLVTKYGYQTLAVQFDADVEIAYQRFSARDKSGERHQGLVIEDMGYDRFLNGVLPNREFSFGSNHIYVNTNDFGNVSYQDITERIRAFRNGWKPGSE